MSSRSRTEIVVPSLSWTEVRDHVRKTWNPGDHASVTAPTGYGKSFLVAHGLLPLWKYVLAVDIKGDDPELVKATHKTVKSYPSRFDLANESTTRFRVVPGGLGDAARHNLDEMFRGVWRSGAKRKKEGTWVVYLDETRIISDQMRMRQHLTSLWVLGRGKGITVIGSTQAPRMVPSEYYDQPVWHWIGNFRDKRTLQRIAEIGGDTDLVYEVVPDLDREIHEFLVLGPGGFTARTAFR